MNKKIIKLVILKKICIIILLASKSFAQVAVESLDAFYQNASEAEEKIFNYNNMDVEQDSELEDESNLIVKKLLLLKNHFEQIVINQGIEQSNELIEVYKNILRQALIAKGYSREGWNEYFYLLSPLSYVDLFPVDLNILGVDFYQESLRKILRQQEISNYFMISNKVNNFYTFKSVAGFAQYGTGSNFTYEICSKAEDQYQMKALVFVAKQRPLCECLPSISTSETALKIRNNFQLQKFKAIIIENRGKGRSGDYSPIFQN